MERTHPRRTPRAPEREGRLSHRPPDVTSTRWSPRGEQGERDPAGREPGPAAGPRRRELPADLHRPAVQHRQRAARTHAAHDERPGGRGPDSRAGATAEALSRFELRRQLRGLSRRSSSRGWSAHRLLGPEGTLYFHIDYREAHYCKLLLDEIFGRECFLNELIWAYDYGARAKRRWPAKHDTILVYVKDPARYHFDSEEVDREPYMAPGLVTAEKVARGKLPTDVWWHTIVPTAGSEQTGYPTQKPEGIVRRMVRPPPGRVSGAWTSSPGADAGRRGGRAGPPLRADRLQPRGRRDHARAPRRARGRASRAPRHVDSERRWRTTTSSSASSRGTSLAST